MTDESPEQSGGKGQQRGSWVKALIVAVILVVALFAVLAGFSAISDFMLFDY